MQRKYPDDPTKEVFEAAKSGDAVLLSEVLQELELNGEITSALETKTPISISTFCAHLTPLIVSVVYRNLDCVKVLLKYQYQADINGRGVGAINLLLGVDERFCKWHESCTPLFAAAAFGNLDILNCLVENGADVNGNTYTNRNWATPLMIASRRGLVKVVTVLIEHGANVDLQDMDGETALHHAVDNELFDLRDVVSCLIKNGADVNAHTNDNCTPLMLACRQGNLNLVTFLLKHGADMKLQDKKGKTALHYADSCYSCDVLSCLIDNGADVNAYDFNNRTPLMIASKNGLVNVVTFLIEHGANVDLQDKDGNTALHRASCSKSFDVSHKLLSLGASQMCNSRGLTPLLFASNNCAISVVENLITRPEFTKEQRIDALELLGSSLAAKKYNLSFKSPVHTGKGFEYIKRGMKERFADSSHPLLKKPMDLVEEFQNRKESQTLEELAQIEGDEHAIIMESLIIRERILETNNAELLGPIRRVARYYGHRLRSPLCMELFRHAIKIAQSCDQSISDLLIDATSFIDLEETVQSYDFPREKVFLELLEQTVLEYDKQRKLRRGLENESHKLQINFEETLESLFASTMDLVQRIAKPKHSDEFKTSHVSVLLKRVFCLNPRDLGGNTLLHTAVDELIGFWNDLPPNCTDTVKLLLNEGFNVNVVNNNGDTPLHRAVTFAPKNNNEMHVLTDMLEALLDGGAHHDFVNNAGKTAMDMARTDEARNILLEKRKLELKCISARAVKKYRLPYLGMVPKTLEKFISMH